MSSVTPTTAMTTATTATAESLADRPYHRADIDDAARRAAARGGHLDDAIELEVRQATPLLTDSQRADFASAVRAALTGLGQLDELHHDPDVDEILVNGTDVWIDRHGELSHAGQLGHPPVEQLIERILAPLGRRLDRTSPIVDARLPDGSRLCAAIEPVAVGGTVLAIRKFRDTPLPLTAFTGISGATLLRQLVQRRCNIMISGATSSGKTSLLAALIHELDTIERLVIVEDTTELPIRAHHVVRLEARQPTADGPPPIDVADLVRAALRLRPDRLIIGEVRGPEIIGLLQALNTGHDGSLSTCHANGTLDALNRLATLATLAAPQWPLAAVQADLHRTIDVVVQVTRNSGGQRRISAIDEVGDLAATVRPLAVADGHGDLRQVADPHRSRR